MKKLNERNIIQIFQEKLDQKRVAEDVETFTNKTGYTVTAIDTLVQSTDMPQNTNLADISRKSIVACISDFAAKGVKPQFGVISLVLPNKYSKKQVTELAKGIQRASKEFKIKILGGDTNKGKELVISVTLFGKTTKNGLVKRRGAKNQDLIYVTGSFGSTAAGLHILLNNNNNKIKSSLTLNKKLEKAFYNPTPKLNFGIKIKKYASSAMDSSDGLAATLNEMSNQSKKKFVVNDIPVQKDVLEFSAKNKIKIEKLVFFGGEEYEFVFTVAPHNITKIKNIAKKERIKLYHIGIVESGSGVFLKNKKIPNKGWQH